MRILISTIFFILFGLFYHLTLADEIKDNTVGPFAGDVSNSMVNGDWGQEDVPAKTDSSFVGEGTINEVNGFFAGDNFDRDVKESTVAPFSGDKNFSGDHYGQ